MLSRRPSSVRLEADVAIVMVNKPHYCPPTTLQADGRFTTANYCLRMVDGELRHQSKLTAVDSGRQRPVALGAGRLVTRRTCQEHAGLDLPERVVVMFQ